MASGRGEKERPIRNVVYFYFFMKNKQNTEIINIILKCIF